MSRLIRKRYERFAAYTPGEQPKDMEYVKLNTNESPYPPAPEVVSALRPEDLERLRLYPDPTGGALKRKLAALYGVEPDNIFISNGSDDILNFACMAFCDEDETLAFPDITYSFYEVIAGLHAAAFTPIPLREDMTVDYRQYCGIGKNIFLPNPNAPTGIALPVEEIEQIVKSNPDHLVLIDEAYVDFGAQSCVPLISRYDNLLVCMTYSKSRSFAGGRLGFAIANAALIQDLETIKDSTNPYSVNSLTMYLAEKALDQQAYYTKNAQAIQENRAYTTDALEKLGFTVLPSQANFVFARHKTAGGGYLYEKLKENGVLVRHFNAPRIRDFNRITIGSREQMDILLDTLRKILNEEPKP